MQLEYRTNWVGLEWRGLSRRWALLGMVLALILSPLAVRAQTIENPPEWQIIVDGLSTTTLQLARPSLFPSKLVVVRASQQFFRPIAVRALEFGRKRSDVKHLAEQSDAWATINANFFDEHGDPLGLIMTRGNVLQDVHRSGSVLSGIFLLDRVGPHIVNRSEFSPKRALEAVQAGPRLLAEGAAVPGLRNPNVLSRRSVVCITRQNELLLLASATRFDRFSLAELQTLLLHPALQCHSALNLDGGGSSQLYVRGSNSLGAISIEGDDPVPVALALVRR